MIKPETPLPSTAIKRILGKLKLNSEYGALPGSTSLKYAASQYFAFKYEDFPCRTVKPVFDGDFEHCYGVYIPYCKSQDMDQYFRWCYQTFGPAGFEMAAAPRKFWFREGKNQTMFLLKWGHR